MTAIKYPFPAFTVNRKYAGIILALLCFLPYPWLSRMLAAGSIAIDPGVLTAVILTILSVLLFQAITWWLIKTIWPVLAQYATENFEQNFKSLLPWQKVIIYLSFYLLLFFSFIATLAVLV